LAALYAGMTTTTFGLFTSFAIGYLTDNIIADPGIERQIFFSSAAVPPENERLRLSRFR
jgi:hypothetical protein